MDTHRQKSTEISVDAFAPKLIYFLVFVSLFTPQFSPTGNIGPGGILRADQFLIPLVIVILALANKEAVRLPRIRFSLGILVITAIITISLLINVLARGYTPEIGDVYDVLIWLTYVLLFMVFGGNLTAATSERSFRLILLFMIPIGILTFFQALGNSFAVETLAPIYTERTVAHRPTGTTSNPNILGKLLFMPLLAFAALFYRSAIVQSPLRDLHRTTLWFLLTGIFAGLIVITGSRSALVSALLGLAVVSLALILGRVGDRRRRIHAVIGVSMCVGVVLFLLIFVFAVGRFRFLANPLQDSSLQTRFDIWRAVIPVILQQPFLGHGPAKQFVTEIRFPFIDSGILRWLYHYGLVGVIGYFYMVLGAVQLGFRGLKDVNLCQDRPALWSAAAVVTGWFSGTLAAWLVSSVPRRRGVFTLALLIAAFVFSYYAHPDRS